MGTTLEPPDGRERRKLATRRALRSATLDLGLERGLSAVPVEEIAARAGVSTRTFFNYFETKEDAALIGLPGITDEQLARLRSDHGVAGLWAELGDLFAADAQRAEHDVPDLARLLRLHEQTPALVARQLGRFTRFEDRLAEAVAPHFGADPTARTRAELIAGAAMTAGRIALRHWSNDERHRPAAFHIESAFALLASTFAGGADTAASHSPATATGSAHA
jgi:AcrR family transcriptional regulator